ncbi:MAG: alpha/beta hydrolase [Chloroflexota bacterium]|nr:alpha/beta hydrolase [Chloroflexota bacterium]
MSGHRRTTGHLPEFTDRTDLVDGLEIFARVPRSPRPGPCPTVVLVHGLSISSRYELPLARRLARTFQVLAPDLPGYGCSDDPDEIPSIAALAGWLCRWLDVVGLGPVAIVGDSLGAHVASEVARKRPGQVSHLILSGLSIDPTGRHRSTQIVRAMRDIPREPLSLLPRHARDFLVAGPGRVMRTLQSAIDDPFFERLGHLPMPTLVVRGERDPVSPRAWSKRVVAALPRGTYAEVPGAPHAVNFARPDAYAALVLLWVASPH